MKLPCGLPVIFPRQGHHEKVIRSNSDYPNHIAMHLFRDNPDVRFLRCLIGVAISVCCIHAISPCLVSGGDWIEVQNVGSFLIRSEFSLDREQVLTDDMESLSSEISKTLGIKISGEATEILLFASRQSYQEYLSHRIPEGVNRPALFVKTENLSRVFAYRCPDLGTNLRHEATHALLHSSLAILPLWLDEGLAEYFEVPERDRSHGNPHLRAMQKWNSRFTWRLQLSNLTMKQEMSEMTSRDYRDAFSCAHFLIHGPPEVRKVFRQYLAEIQDGAAPDPLEKQLSRLYRHPEIAVLEHVRKW